MRILVTTGNTQVPIDRVRCITNVFSGRTGTAIALHAHNFGHHVHLLTSRPELVDEMTGKQDLSDESWEVTGYQTFEDLEIFLPTLLNTESFDALIHCAAVSDYLLAGVYAPKPGARFVPEQGQWHTHGAEPLSFDERSAGKIKSLDSELWLRLTRAPKLIDQIRTRWHFRGILVKFKLEVGVGEDRLQEIAEESRRDSGADLMVANSLEGANDWAYLGPLAGKYQRIERSELPAILISAVEKLHRERGHG
jgi:phosphopantothenoylcysteine synthetase/decarboxylase